MVWASLYLQLPQSQALHQATIKSSQQIQRLPRASGTSSNPVLCTGSPKPILGVEVSSGVRWHEKHLPSSMHNSQSQCPGCGQAAHVTMNQTPPNLSLPSTNPSPKHTDDGLVWNTLRPGAAHRRLDRTGVCSKWLLPAARTRPL